MSPNHILDIITLAVLVLAAIWTVMTRSLIRSAIGLGVTSAALAIVMFEFNSPLAGVFELSVCAGLISVIFISAVSLTKPMTQEEVVKYMRQRLARFIYLPFIVIAAGILISLLHTKFSFHLPPAETQTSIRNVLWNNRQLDLLGQILVIITGVFGVVILFKERKKEK
jgi:NADH-quinone oxidoreductase subunit J